MNGERLLANLESWIHDFQKTIADWDRWLHQCQLQYLLGQFESLASMQLTGQSIVSRLQSLHRLRHDLLDHSIESGYPGRNLQELARVLDLEFQVRMAIKVSQLQPQLRRLSQQNVSLWVSMLQSETHTASVLRILATGASSSATYHPNESESIGGGQLVNQAA